MLAGRIVHKILLSKKILIVFDFTSKIMLVLSSRSFCLVSCPAIFIISIWMISSIRFEEMSFWEEMCHWRLTAPSVLLMTLTQVVPTARLLRYRSVRLWQWGERCTHPSLHIPVADSVWKFLLLEETKKIKFAYLLCVLTQISAVISSVLCRKVVCCFIQATLLPDTPAVAFSNQIIRRTFLASKELFVQLFGKF